jgi:hypothetical protein
VNIRTYMTTTGLTAVYPSANTGDLTALTYATLGLVGESTEVLEKETNGQTDGLVGELGDTAWYLARLHVELGLDPALTFASPDNDGPATSSDLVVAAGRVAETIKKVIRDSNGQLTPTRRDALVEGLTAVSGAWVGVHIAHNLLPSDTLDANIAKTQSRLERGVLSGSGDNR